jgi:serine/threonine protein kinase
MSVCINPNCANPNNQDTMLFCQSCGSELLLEERYRTIRQLGKGGFSITYEIRDCKVNNLKVLKVLSNNHPKYIELFQRESQILSCLDHPGIPKVEPDAYFTFYPHQSNTPLYCLVMQKIEGLDLKEYIQHRGRPISEKRALEWLLQLINILQEVHNRNFFHRDIKPSNIMLQADGQLVLIDFGSAREITATYMWKQSEGEVTGVMSSGYTPIEQMNGQALPQSDFFALGRTFIFLLTGKQPNEFYDSTIDNLNWRSFVPQISTTFADFLDYLMARSADRRPQNAQIIFKTLTQIYETLYPVQNFNSGTFLPNIQSNHLTLPPSRGSLEEASQSLSKLHPGFLIRCEQELAEFIGPIAKIICQRILNNNPGISARDYIELLAAKIADPVRASEFKKKFD